MTKKIIQKKYPSFEYTEFHDTPITPLSKPINECKLALVTTGGLHLSFDTPFDTKHPEGDCSYRKISRSITVLWGISMSQNLCLRIQGKWENDLKHWE